MSLTAKDLIVYFRRNAEDPSWSFDNSLVPINTMWSNYQLLQYIDLSLREFAERSWCFNDEFTITVTADDPEVNIDNRIIQIKRAKLNTANSVLSLADLENFSVTQVVDDYGFRRLSPSWETTTGTPRTLITDYKPGIARLYPIPTTADTITVNAYCYPEFDTETIHQDDDIPLPETWAYRLLDGVMAKAFSIPIAVSVLKDLYRGYELKWNDTLVSGRKFFQTKNRDAPTVRYGGI